MIWRLITPAIKWFEISLIIQVIRPMTYWSRIPLVIVVWNMLSSIPKTIHWSYHSLFICPIAPTPHVVQTGAQVDAYLYELLVQWLHSPTIACGPTSQSQDVAQLIGHTSHWSYIPLVQPNGHEILRNTFSLRDVGLFFFIWESRVAEPMGRTVCGSHIVALMGRRVDSGRTSEM